jgi:putative flippase GtrA
MGRIENFKKYFAIGLLSTVCSTLLLVLMVDHLKIWVGFANPIVVLMIFITRFFVYEKSGLLTK